MQLYDCSNSTQTIMDIYGYSSEAIRTDIVNAIRKHCAHELDTEEEIYNTIRCLNPLQIEDIIEEGLKRITEEGVDIEHYAYVCKNSFEMMSDTRAA